MLNRKFVRYRISIAGEAFIAIDIRITDSAETLVTCPSESCGSTESSVRVPERRPQSPRNRDTNLTQILFTCASTCGRIVLVFARIPDPKMLRSYVKILGVKSESADILLQPLVATIVPAATKTVFWLISGFCYRFAHLGDKRYAYSRLRIIWFRSQCSCQEKRNKGSSLVAQSMHTQNATQQKRSGKCEKYHHFLIR